jgi:tRNA pseudouridine32 synthase/23S rRNA pseudouridine746 synthase
MTLGEGRLDIIHEDPHFVVVNKASGMLSVPGRLPEKKDSVANRVRELYPGCIEQPAVHRLDMATSGLIVVARDAAAHRNLSMQFQERTPRKEYVALLDGGLESPRGVIELRFRLDVENRPRQIYDEIHGKLGVTHWETIAVESGITRVRFMPITGRTHQLRVHAAHERGLGVPIVGDALYGTGTKPSDLKLHATRLGFRHPVSGSELTFGSDPPF